MPRISHQVFDSKAPGSGPRALLRSGYQSLRAGLATSLGLSAGAPAGTNAFDNVEQHGTADGVRHGFQQGVQDGPQRGQHDGQQHGKRDGSGDGALDGHHDGHHDGLHHGNHDGKSNGPQHGGQDGTTHGTALEHELGVEFHLVNGVVEAFEPGQDPPQEPIDHAEDLLTWLQGQALFAGCWVPSKLLEERLYPYLAKKMDWTPYAWRTIATEFAALDGVARRQDDRRRGNRRIGPTPVVYYIPFPNRNSAVADQTAVVVDLAAERREA